MGISSRRTSGEGRKGPRNSRRISEAGADIELAAIDTAGGRVRDEFLLSRAGGPLGVEGRSEVIRALAGLAVVKGPAAESRTAAS